MKSQFKPGDIVYFVENANRVKEAEIVRCSNGSCIIRFSDRRGGTRLSETRLFHTEEEAQATTRKGRKNQNG